MKIPQMWDRARDSIKSAETRYDIGVAVILGSKLPEKIFDLFSDRSRYPNPGAWTVRQVMQIGIEQEEASRVLAFCKEESRNSRPSPLKVAARALGYTEWSSADSLVSAVRTIRRMRREAKLEQAHIALQHLNENGISAAVQHIRAFSGTSQKPKSHVDMLSDIQDMLRKIRKDCPDSVEYALEQTQSWVNATKELMWSLTAN